MTRSAIIRGIAALAGTAFVVSTTISIGDEQFIIRDLFFWGVYFMLPISLLLSLLDRGNEFFVGLFILAGISIGVLIDVAMDGTERNLFPLEIMFWYVLIGPTVLLGSGIAWLIGKLKHNQSNKAQPPAAGTH